VLREVKDSRLVFLTAAGSQREWVLGILRREGIEAERVEFAEICPRRDYLKLYHRLDVVLDPFPYNGHTTSLDALWMGVPVVSLAGTSPVSRGGLGILTNIGLPELIAWSQEEYVNQASALARDLPRLARLRATLRSRMEASPLMDARGFTQAIENAYRTMWRHWCHTEQI
jgi:predicted O-linked N-acetylglucosamine transferase (SPINDLY family)